MPFPGTHPLGDDFNDPNLCLGTLCRYPEGVRTNRPLYMHGMQHGFRERIGFQLKSCLAIFRGKLAVNQTFVT